ncbi:CSL-type zinc finger protein-containing protein, putative [Pediculus humanus corporis]|uniref:CSL-type zinc finger protein-containing protein, putative n=1 Tax=Pediculus humanus subsp. corporis TaxID=121224 RepID=E0VIC3_PEDHC|nr:CSL-type zinc finger protein-containing protein, putative [Pediculus humanus corporis]EEB13129.1 CSL-type zinc finger protein-containing protein, putative [Pediculus humanus corporis]
MINYYEILGCDKNATRDEIKKCYYERVKKYHPDKTDENKSRREEYLRLDEAWKVLRNPETRLEYDLSMSKNDLKNTPLYCKINLEEMSREEEEEEGVKGYSYTCRCGGNYFVDEEEIHSCEELAVPCDECTFHIVVNLKK